MAESHGQEEGKKSPKKLIMIVLIVLAALAAGAGGTYFFLAKQADSAHAKPDEKAHHEEEAKHEEEAHEEAPAADVYYDLATPLLVNFPAGSSAKVIKISLTMLVKGEAAVAALKKHEPMLRNNLLMAISAVGAEKAKTSEGKQELRAMMLSEIGKVLEKMAGKNTVKEVYFTEFVMQ